MRVLITGLGSIGQRHARNLGAVVGPELELLAYRVRGLRHVITPELDLDTGADVERTFNLKLYSDFDQALSQQPDVVFVTNPNDQHIPIAVTAAQAGCNLFIEKPLSNSLEGVSELIELVDVKKLVCFVGYQLRFHPCIRRTQSLLNTHVIGRVISARLTFGEYLPDWHKYEDYRQYHASRKDQGGGVILSQIHDLDYACLLFGMPRKVFALGGKFSDLEIDVEDTASILMECIVEGTPVPVHIHQDYVQRPPTRTCEVIGEAGKIFLDLNRPSVRVFDDRQRLVEEQIVDDFQRNDLFMDEIRHFLGCLERKERPMVTIRDAANSLRVAVAAKASLATGEVVVLS